MSGKPVFDEHDRFRGYRGVARDATQALQMEQPHRTHQPATTR